MDWKKMRFKLPGKMTKESWIVLLCIGLILMILSMPFERRKNSVDDQSGAAQYFSFNGERADNAALNGTALNGTVLNGTALSEAGKGMEGAGTAGTGLEYEAALERRVKEVLNRVDGVGAVDVLIVLKSSEERVYRTDGKSSHATTREQDSSGGSREIDEQQEERSTVLSSGGGGMDGSGSGPLLEKELRPEISGIIISAEGGGSPAVQAEITGAMEALFGLPAHKIKVLKRAGQK